MSRLKFRANHGKAVEAIKWLIMQDEEIEKTQLIGIMFFAEKFHLNRWARPIIGSTYIKTDENSLDWSIFNKIICKCATGGPDLDYFSESDLESLGLSYDKYKDFSAEEMTQAICKERCFTSAQVSEEIDFRLMIGSDTKNRKDYIKYVQELSYYLEL